VLVKDVRKMLRGLPADAVLDFSVDISTCDEDVGIRVFADTMTEIQEDGDNSWMILMVGRVNGNLTPDGKLLEQRFYVVLNDRGMQGYACEPTENQFIVCSNTDTAKWWPSWYAADNWATENLSRSCFAGMEYFIKKRVGRTTIQRK
jgi:hypothetical protein